MIYSRTQLISRCVHRTRAIMSLILALAGTSLAHAATDIIETFIAPATSENPRNTEADLLVLRDGSLFVAWSEFYGGARDDAPARISAARSQDGGKTWSPRFTLQENSGKANVMS